jgi:hypothetical protein
MAAMLIVDVTFKSFEKCILNVFLGEVIRIIKSLVVDRSGYELVVHIVLDRSNAGNLGSNSTRGVDVCFLCACVVLCKHGPGDGPISRPRNPTKCFKRNIIFRS